MAAMTDNYKDRKRFFDNLLTIYGRKPVLEALRDETLGLYCLHLATTNRSEGILREIEARAKARQLTIRYHSRDELSRISKDRRQDQGVALDLKCGNYQHYGDFLDTNSLEGVSLIALDRITNPQNLGMIIRSVCASPIQGLLLPSKGCAPLSPLVIKSSAGTIFQCTILRCNELAEALHDFAAKGAEIGVLSGLASQSLAGYRPASGVVYVLGNETEGVSQAVLDMATTQLRIPMARGVESLNVAVTAALVAFRDVLATDY